MSEQTYNRVTRDSSPQSYNWANPSDKEIQFYFWLIPGFQMDGKDRNRYGMSVEPEFADSIDESLSPFEVAEKLHEYAQKRYLISRHKTELAPLVEFLRPHHYSDLIAAKTTEIKRLKERLDRAEKELMWLCDEKAESEQAA